jgi:NodT family efflux transporter outer membrane factor (OMF) lipoprotein
MTRLVRCRSGFLRWLALIGAVGTAFGNAGCLTTGPLDWVENGFKVGPNYQRPPAPVAPEWIAAPNGKAQDSPKHPYWWSVFGDPVLNQLIVTAYRQNLTLRVAGTRVLQARAQQSIAVGAIFPQLQEATGSFSQVNLSHNTFNNPSAFADTASKPPPPGTPVGNFYPNWSSGFNLSWELDFWGRFRRTIESANASLDASVEDYDDALVTLVADVATNYVQYRVAQQRIKIAVHNAAVQEALVAIAKRQLNAGLTIELDVQQLSTLWEQTRSTIPALRITLGQANDALCTLLGLPPRDLEGILGPGPELGSAPLPTMPDSVAAGIPADLLRQRPDVRSAERQAAAQSARIGVAEADLYPAIFINGTLGWEAPDLSKLFESRSFFGTITPQFRWNILNYGRITNIVRLQVAREQELIAAYQNRVLTAARETQTALRGFWRSREQAETLERSVKAAVTATGFEEKRFETIKLDINRLFTLEATQLQEQDNLAVAQGNIALNLINVYRALGGGWEIRCAEAHGGHAPPAESPQKMPPADDDREELPLAEPVPQPR